MEEDPKDNRIFTKRKSRGRIDGMVALAMCAGLADAAPARRSRTTTCPPWRSLTKRRQVRAAFQLAARSNLFRRPMSS
jgi:phage terminase large subunit-like protein